MRNLILLCFYNYCSVSANNEKISELAIREIISIVAHHDDKTTTQDDDNNKIKAERRLKEFSDAEIIALKDNFSTNLSHGFNY